MPNNSGIRNKVIRIPDSLWADAKIAAARAGEPLSTVVIQALVAYVADPPEAGSRNAVRRMCPRCGREVGPVGGNSMTLARHHTDDGVWCSAVTQPAATPDRPCPQ